MLVLGVWFLHYAISIIVIYQCIKFQLIPLHTFRDMLWGQAFYAPDKLFIVKIKTESNCINTVNRVMILACGTFSHCPLSMYRVSFNSLVYFHRSAPDKIFTANIKKGK